MSPTLALLYFSGTGNTELVTDFLQQSLTKCGQCDRMKIEDIVNGKQPFEADRYDTIGIGYPVLGFNAPSIVFDLVNMLPDSTGKDVFIFSTCAGPFYLNDTAAFFLKRKLGQRGYRVFYERQFYMPPNIAIRYRDEVARQLCDAAAIKCAEMAADIINRRICVRNDRFIPWLLFWLRWCEWASWRTLPFDFRRTKNCTLCGTCAASCPRDNISIRSKKVRFGLRCMACYRCVYKCPQHAIRGRLYDFAILKGGYDIRRIADDASLEGNYISDSTRGYYRSFLPYLNEPRQPSGGGPDRNLD